MRNSFIAEEYNAIKNVKTARTIVIIIVGLEKKIPYLCFCVNPSASSNRYEICVFFVRAMM